MIDRQVRQALHHENVVWQTADGDWRRGFFARVVPSDPDDGYDPEWDDTFNRSRFELVSPRFPSETAALAWRHGRPHPGGCEVSDPVLYTGFDAMADEWEADAVASLLSRFGTAASSV